MGAPFGTLARTSIAEDQVPETEGEFKSIHPAPTSVISTKQADGTWTVTATWPGDAHVAAALPPATLKGFDADRDCGRFIDKIKGAKVAFVIRYYSHTPDKNISFSEARALSDAGVNLVTVWETQGNHVGFFNRLQGVDDSTSAYRQATRLGQPGGTPIYFAVDFDAEQPQVAGPITEYFHGLAQGFAAAGNDIPAYTLGVYGSGRVCAWLAQRKLVTHTWLAMSRGWAQSRDYHHWNLLQHLEADPYGFGFNIDPNEARPDYGGFRI